MVKYKRVLLKLSGESLMGSKLYGIDPDQLNNFARQIKEISDMGTDVGIVIGGGNIFRGLAGTESGIDRVKGDYMGMLATVINGLAIQSALEKLNKKSKVLTAVKMEPFGEGYSKQKCIDSFLINEVVIFTAGTGNPYFTTDTAAALRAVEIEAEVLLKGTRVDGVYSADPEKDKNAVKFKSISFNEAYQKKLNIMDLTAFTMCRENNVPIIVFNMNKKGNLKSIILGENLGTVIKS